MDLVFQAIEHYFEHGFISLHNSFFDCAAMDTFFKVRLPDRAPARARARNRFGFARHIKDALLQGIIFLGFSCNNLSITLTMQKHIRICILIQYTDKVLCVNAKQLKAREAYEKIKATAREAYLQVEVPAWEAYLKVRGPAWEAYLKVVGPAGEAYEKAMGPAWEAYEKVEGPAWESYLKAMSEEEK